MNKPVQCVDHEKILGRTHICTYSNYLNLSKMKMKDILMLDYELVKIELDR